MEKSGLCLILAFIFNLMPAQEPVRKPEISFKEIGKIKPLKAKDIKSSYLGVGCEVLDRDYTCYDCYKEYLGNLGVKHARFQSGWAKTEKQKGIYDFAWIDNVIDDCISRGIEPWIDIIYGNPIYPGGGDIQIGTYMPHGEIALKAWDDYVYNLVNHFKKRVYKWEVWNESNNLRGELAGPDIYGDLYIRTAEIIRKIQPEGKTIALAISDADFNYVEAFFDHLKLKNKVHLVDIVSLHGYPSNPDAVADKLQRMRNIVDKYNKKITFLQGESGAPSTSGTSGAMGKVNFSELIQTKWDLRRSFAHFGRGIPHSQFAISDMKYPKGMNTKGLLKMNEDKTIAYPKQSYFAYQNLTSLFDSSVVSSVDISCDIDTKEAYEIFSFYDEKVNTPVIAYYYSGKVPDNEVKVKNELLRIKEEAYRSAVLVDIRTGIIYEVPATSLKVDDNGIEMTLPIYDSPLIVCDKSFLKKRKIFQVFK
jgi:hypothetical protein